MDNHQQNTQEAVANLDPLLQPLNDQHEDPLYYGHRSSIFYNPSSIINENTHSDTCCSSLKRFSGIVYALIASLLFTCTNFVIKQLDVVLLDVFLIRFLIQGLISFGFIIFKGYHPLFTNSHGLFIIFRSLIAAIGSILFYIGLSLLQLPDLITIRYTQVVWTALLAMIIFRERITLPTIFASMLTIVGVICVAQPTFLFPKFPIFNGTLSESIKQTNEHRFLGMFIALLCAICTSLTIILTKKLLEYKVRQSIIMFYFILTISLILFIVQIHYWTFSKTNQQKFDIRKIYLRKTFFYATLLATLQLIPMVLTQKAIKREHPSIISVVQASDILFSIVLQNLFSTEKSNGLAVIGSTLVLISIAIVGGHKLWKDRQNRLCLPGSLEENN